MSELTQCNYCSLQIYKERAKEENKVLHQINTNGWIDIYLVPKGEKLDTRQDKKTGNHLSNQWKCSFMQISDSCVC